MWNEWVKFTEKGDFSLLNAAPSFMSSLPPAPVSGLGCSKWTTPVLWLIWFPCAGLNFLTLVIHAQGFWRLLFWLISSQLESCSPPSKTPLCVIGGEISVFPAEWHKGNWCPGNKCINSLQCVLFLYFKVLLGEGRFKKLSNKVFGIFNHLLTIC